MCIFIIWTERGHLNCVCKGSAPAAARNGNLIYNTLSEASAQAIFQRIHKWITSSLAFAREISTLGCQPACYYTYTRTIYVYSRQCMCYYYLFTQTPSLALLCCELCCVREIIPKCIRIIQNETNAPLACSRRQTRAHKSRYS